MENLQSLGEELGIIWANMDILAHKGCCIDKETIIRKNYIYELSIDNKEQLYKIAQKKSDELWEEYTKTEEYIKNENLE